MNVRQAGEVGLADIHSLQGFLESGDTALGLLCSSGYCDPAVEAMREGRVLGPL